MEALRRQLVAVAIRLLWHQGDAEDVAQEAVVRLLAARRNGTPVADERAFATRIAVRLAIDRVRATVRARRWRLGPRRDEQPESGATAADIQKLYDAIGRLPARQAAVITLRKLMELEYADIADILGISVENCRSHCRLAMRRLRELLNDEA